MKPIASLVLILFACISIAGATERPSKGCVVEKFYGEFVSGSSVYLDGERVENCSGWCPRFSAVIYTFNSLVRAGKCRPGDKFTLLNTLRVTNDLYSRELIWLFKDAEELKINVAAEESVRRSKFFDEDEISEIKFEEMTWTELLILLSRSHPNRLFSMNTIISLIAEAIDISSTSNITTKRMIGFILDPEENFEDSSLEHLIAELRERVDAETEVNHVAEIREDLSLLETLNVIAGIPPDGGDRLSIGETLNVIAGIPPDGGERLTIWETMNVIAEIPSDGGSRLSTWETLNVIAGNSPNGGDSLSVRETLNVISGFPPGHRNSTAIDVLRILRDSSH